MKRKHKMLKKIKSGQEELVGFGIIIVILAVIMLFFLWFFISKQDNSVKSYEVESFLHSTLQFTSECRHYREGYLDINDLIFECENEFTCLNGEYSCEVLNSTISGILKESYIIRGNSPVKGYKLEINIENNVLLNIKSGNETGNSRGAYQEIPERGDVAIMSFNIYT